MRIILNGRDEEVKVSNLKELLVDLNLKREFCAVELDGKIIRKEDDSEHFLKEGSKVEILRFVGGG